MNERSGRACRPQFHAIESAWTKLKTNRFPAPCWHALRRYAARATWSEWMYKKKKEKRKNQKKEKKKEEPAAKRHTRAHKRDARDRFTRASAQKSNDCRVRWV